MVITDYHAILGVARSATDGEIKRAYKKLALRYHPDKNDAADAEERFKAVNEAYNTLYDKKRHSLEKTGKENRKTSAGGGQSGGGGGTPRGDGHPSRGPRSRKSKGFREFTYSFEVHPIATFNQIFCVYNSVTINACYYHLDVSLEELLLGCVKKITITRKVVNGDDKCYRKEDKEFIVDVKPGSVGGTRIRFPNEFLGFENIGATPSDIVFVVEDQPHPHFARNGADIVYTATISPIEAIRGCTLNVPTLTGEPLTVSVNLDDAMLNTSRTMPGHGLPYATDPTRRGDLIINFKLYS